MRKSNGLIALGLVTTLVTSLVTSLAACTGNVNLGGPRDDGGTSADATDQDAAPQSQADGGIDSAQPDSAGQDANDPSTGIDQASAYANGNVSCTTAADCCAVFDGCLNRGFVVGVADKDKVASLLADYDHYEQTIGSESRCTLCVAPPIQVSCVQNKCIGALLPFQTADGGTVDSALRQNHCGTIGGPATSTTTGSILGC